MALKGRRFRRDHPTEEGIWIEFAELGWMSKQQARTARQHDQFAGIRHMGGEVFREITRVDPAEIRRQTEAETDPHDVYDTYTILMQGIVSWNYPEPCNPDAIVRLDDETMAWAKREILEASDVRPLASPASSPSTAPSTVPVVLTPPSLMNGNSPSSAIPSAALPT